MTESSIGWLADSLDARCEAIVESIVEASRVEIPEYARLTDEARMRQRARNMFGIKVLISMIRVGRHTFEPSERELLVSAAREVAREPEPLHAVIRTYQIASRELMNAALDVATELGDQAAPSIEVAFRIGFDLLAILVESVERAFAEQIASSAKVDTDRVSPLVADLVLGTAPEAYERRAHDAGLKESDSYRVIVATFTDIAEHGRDLDAAREEISRSLAPGHLCARVGQAITVIAPESEQMSGDETAAQIAGAIEALCGSALVTIGSPNSSLRSLRESFEEAIDSVESARALGLTGHLSLARSALPRLVASAQKSGIEVAAILRPILERNDSDEMLSTLAAYLHNACSVHRAAEALHMHRNTIRRRLRSMEDLFGFEIRFRWAELELALLAVGSYPERSTR